MKIKILLNWRNYDLKEEKEEIINISKHVTTTKYFELAKIFSLEIRLIRKRLWKLKKDLMTK